MSSSVVTKATIFSQRTQGNAKNPFGVLAQLDVFGDLQAYVSLYPVKSVQKFLIAEFVKNMLILQMMGHIEDCAEVLDEHMAKICDTGEAFEAKK